MTLGAREVISAYGMDPVLAFAADVDRDAMSVYRDNFSIEDKRVFTDDIAELLTGTVGRAKRKCESDLISKIGRVDVLLAGPPCQGHSDLNNRTRRNDERNWLYLKAIRFAELFRPKVILIENVRSVTLDKIEVVKTAQEILDNLGYFIQDDIFNASELGLPQLRKRHLLLATRKRIPKFRTSKVHAIPALSSVIDDLTDEYVNANGDMFRSASRLSPDNLKRVRYLFAKDLYDLPNSRRPACHRDKSHSYVSMYGRLRWDRPAQTITSGFGSPGQGRYIHPERPRVITPHEAARIQGFPDYFSFASVTRRFKLQEIIANAVPPVLAAAVLEHVIINGGLDS